MGKRTYVHFMRGRHQYRLLSFDIKVVHSVQHLTRPKIPKFDDDDQLSDKLKLSTETNVSNWKMVSSNQHWFWIIFFLLDFRKRHGFIANLKLSEISTNCVIFVRLSKEGQIGSTCNENIEIRVHALNKQNKHL